MQTGPGSGLEHTFRSMQSNSVVPQTDQRSFQMVPQIISHILLEDAESIMRIRFSPCSRGTTFSSLSSKSCTAWSTCSMRPRMKSSSTLSSGTRMDSMAKAKVLSGAS
ncbi:hypothetical protein RSAG8_00567, partial [Rhizoctonia solani AG-8 WAC10335]